MFDYRTNATTIQPTVWKGDERVYQQEGFVLAPNF